MLSLCQGIAESNGAFSISGKAVLMEIINKITDFLRVDFFNKPKMLSNVSDIFNMCVLAKKSFDTEIAIS